MEGFNADHLVNALGVGVSNTAPYRAEWKAIVVRHFRTINDPAIRWFPADEALHDTSTDKFMPPLVSQLRKKVKEWRDSGYVGATNTSKSLLN